MKPQEHPTNKTNSKEIFTQNKEKITKIKTKFENISSESKTNFSSYKKTECTNQCNDNFTNLDHNDYSKQWSPNYPQQEYYNKLQNQYHQRMQNLENGNSSLFFDYPYTNNHHMSLKINNNQQQINTYHLIQAKKNQSTQPSEPNFTNNLTSKNSGISNNKHSNQFNKNQKFEFEKPNQVTKLLNNQKENLNNSQDLRHIVNTNVILF